MSILVFTNATKRVIYIVFNLEDFLLVIHIWCADSVNYVALAVWLLDGF